MLFKINGLCRLVVPPELRYSQSGSAICKLYVINSEKYGDKESKCPINATVFGKAAEIINQYCTKGSRLFISGKLQIEEWEDQGGNKHSKHSIIIEAFEFASDKNESQNAQNPPKNGSEYINKGGRRQTTLEDDLEDQIPF